MQLMEDSCSLKFFENVGLDFGKATQPQNEACWRTNMILATRKSASRDRLYNIRLLLVFSFDIIVIGSTNAVTSFESKARILIRLDAYDKHV